MPIDPDFEKNRQVVSEHNDHKVWGPVEPPTKLGVHGTTTAVDWDVCVGDGVCADVCPVSLYDMIETPGHPLSNRKADPAREKDRPLFKVFSHETLLAETDRLDSAQLTLQDVVSPEGYVLLGFTLDGRSGLGSQREYFQLLLPAVRDRPLAEVLALPEVRERVSVLRERDQAFRETALAHSRLDGEVVVTDFRPLPVLPVGNRFLVFTLFPQASVALRLQRLDDGKVSISAGRSIFNRACRANLGVLLSLHGGGGHPGAAACVVPAAQADTHVAEIVAALKRNV